MTQPQRIALGDLSVAVKTWLSDLVRIDNWSIDFPDPVEEVINGVTYPANSAVQLSPRRINYESSAFGLKGSAEIRTLIQYRFNKGFKYHELPLQYVANLLNNIYHYAVNSPASIHPAILGIRTPDNGVDITVGTENEADSDWLVSLQVDLYIQFKAKLGSLGPLQPDEEDTPFVLRQLRIGVHRAKAGDFSVNRLDREITIGSLGE